MQSVIEHKERTISVENVSFSYDGKHDVLSDVSLAVYKGDYLGLIGPNGGGKTTLVKLILGLLVPESGTLALFGKDACRFKERYRIGYVSQRAVDFDSLFPATVEEVVLMGRYAKRGLFRRTTPEDQKISENALKQVEMLEYRHRRISDLSGGQKQRVFLARALASEPELIVLDEPTNGIDEGVENRFFELLSRLNKEEGMTLVLVSHDLERISKEATRIAVVDRTLRYYEHPADAVTKEDVHALHRHHHA